MSVKTYNEAMQHVYEYEGGYSNDADDSGGPTNYGITIHDARMYWKANASAADVRAMPKSVAADIYRKHYAAPIHYDELPSGIDFAVLDYGINSGISRAVKVLQRIVGAVPDGQIGPITIAATKRANHDEVINAICDERMKFLRGLRIFRTFGKGWTSRVKDVRATALHMTD